jgi:hypothetical protein
VIIEGKILHLSEESKSKLVYELEFTRDSLLIIEHPVRSYSK